MNLFLMNININNDAWRKRYDAWTWTCCMDVYMMHAQGHDAGTWTYFVDMDMLHKHGH
jgi:hypothetical protein